MKFNQLYKSIINEGNYQFKEKIGSINLPLQYLKNLPQVKQCCITGHAMDKYVDRIKWNFNIFDNNILFRNIQLFLERLLRNDYMMEKINKNQYKSQPIECICSTTKRFGGKEGLHLCLTMKVNSKTNKETNQREYYFLITTIFYKIEDSWLRFRRQGHISKQHPDQLPMLIVGQNIEI